LTDALLIAAVVAFVAIQMAVAVLCLVWFADRRGVDRAHALWGLAGLLGLVVGALGILIVERSREHPST
jgi:hypothetical protein